MKRVILLCAIAVMSASNAFGWGRVGHATIAKIAEEYADFGVPGSLCIGK